MKCCLLFVIFGLLQADVRVINVLDPDTCPPQLDIAFLLDTSGGADDVYSEEIRWIKAIVNNLPIHQDAVRVALLQYAGIPIVEFSLDSNDDKTEVIKKIDLIEFHSGVTKTGAALNQAEIELFSPLKGARINASKIIILFTDGLSIDDPNSASSRLRDVKGVNIYVISVGTDGFVPEMQKIAGDADNVFGPADLYRFNEHLAMDVEASRKCTGSMDAEVEATSTIATVTEHPETIEMKIPEEMTKKLRRRKIKVVRRKGAGGTIVKEEIITKPNGKKVRRVVRRRKPTTPVATATTVRLSSSMEVIEEVTTSRALTSRKRFKVLGKKTTPVINGVTIASNSISDFPTLMSSSATPLTRATAPRRTTTELRTTTVPRTTTAITRTTSTVKAQTTTSRFTPTTTKFTRLFHTTAARSFALNNRASNISDCPMDILFVVDSSGSIGSVYEKQKAFLSSVLSSVSLQEQFHRVAFIQFAGAKLQKMERDFASFKHSEEIMKTFNGLRHFTGTTYIGSALEMVLLQLESRRKDVPTIVIVLSDGFSHDDVREPATSIRAQHNVEVFVGSLAHLSNVHTLLEIAGDESHLYINDEEIEVLKRKLLNRMQCRL